MSELVFLKLGGSLLTDKRREATFRRGECRRLGAEIKAALASSSLRLLLGHGAGSFGHFVARRYNTAQGLAGGGGWKGYAETRRAVTDLDHRVLRAFADSGFYPFSVSPSSCARASGGRLRRMAAAVIQRLLEQGQVPLVFGDALLDDLRGFTICSTEDIFRGLAHQLRPARVLVACDVDGVFGGGLGGRRIRTITRANLAKVLAQIQQVSPARAGRDVTGGMAHKLEVLAEVAAIPEVKEIRIFSGLVKDAVRRALLGEYEGGTVLRLAPGRLQEVR